MKRPRLLLAPLVLFVGIFVAWPTFSVLRRGLQWSTFDDLISSSTIRQTLWFTTWQALLSTFVTLIVAIPITALLSRVAFPFRSVVRALTLVPFVLPTLVVAMAIVAIAPGSMRYGLLPLVAAHVYLNIAIVVRMVGIRWEQLPRELSEAAKTLGAHSLAIWKTVTWPLLRGSIIGAGGVVFMFCFSTYGAARVLAGPRNPTVEIEIYRSAVLLGDLSTATGLAVAQVFIVGAVFLFTSRRHCVGLSLGSPRPISHFPPFRRVLLTLAITAVTIVMAVPLISLATRSLYGTKGLTLTYWRAAFNTRSDGAQLATALAASLKIAVVATLLALFFGMLASSAYVYSRSRLVSLVVTGISSLPVVISAVVLGLGYLLAFRSDPFNWRGSWWLLPTVHATIALPLVVRSVTPTLESIDPYLREAASVLGASPAQVWRNIDLAILKKPLIVAGSLAATISLGEFGATSLLSRRGSETLTMTLSRLLGRPGDLLRGQVFVVASVLAFLCVFLTVSADYFLSHHFGKRRHNGTP